MTFSRDVLRFCIAKGSLRASERSIDFELVDFLDFTSSGFLILDSAFERYGLDWNWTGLGWAGAFVSIITRRTTTGASLYDYLMKEYIF